MNFLNFFNKKEEDFWGINFDNNGKIQIIALKKTNKSFFPVFALISDKIFLNENNFNKEKFISFFKKYHQKLNTEVIKINSLKNKKIEQSVISALKILNFKKINVLTEHNIYGLILKKNVSEELVLLPQEERIKIILNKNNFIVKEQEISLADLNFKNILELTKNLKQKHIFVIGFSPEMLKAIKKLFNQAGIKVHQKNIWENFLDFNDGIPQILAEDSQQYLEILSLVIPNLKKWEKISVEKKQEKEVKQEKKAEKKKQNKKIIQNFLPKNKKKIFLPKNKKKIFLPKKVKLKGELFKLSNKSQKTFWQKSKKFFNTKL